MGRLSARRPTAPLLAWGARGRLEPSAGTGAGSTHKALIVVPFYSSCTV